MNIFILDKNMKKCAEAHFDKHVVKMRIEYNQLLCSAHHFYKSKSIPYKYTHKNHPSSIWTRESIENYELLYELNRYLCEEFKYRYGTEQKSSDILKQLKKPPKNIPIVSGSIPYIVWNENKYPEMHKTKNIISTNRLFYKLHKIHLLSYTERNIPKWLI